MNHSDVWEDLSRQAVDSRRSGLIRRRVLHESSLNCFLAIEVPSNSRLIALSVDASLRDRLSQLPRTQGIELRVVSLPEHPGCIDLQLVLLDPGSLDMFSSFADNILSHLSGAGSDSEGAGIMIGRFRQWQHFLNQQSLSQLGHNAQIGLYGELWFLRMLLQEIGPEFDLLSWHGPLLAAQDFYFPGCTVEVKTGVHRPHQEVEISSEGQLSVSQDVVLYIFHLSINRIRNQGESLVDMVESIRDLLGDASGRRADFESRLESAGFMDDHVEYYLSPGYSVREENVFLVSGDFPRIEPGDLRAGIGNVRYSIALEECRNFAVDRTNLLEMIRGQHD